MKGVVFNILEDMVVEKGGVVLWQQLLNKAGVEGSYISVDTYEDAELFKIVHEVQQALDIPLEEVIRSFGDFMFAKLADRYPMFVEAESELFGFLKSIEPVIHLEVQKLYTEANLPSIDYTNGDSDRLVMDYRSPRKLCILAEGLIQGAATYYQTPIKIEHNVCMHRESDHCELSISKVNV
jgi:hypothetical protein